MVYKLEQFISSPKFFRKKRIEYRVAKSGKRKNVGRLFLLLKHQAVIGYLEFVPHFCVPNSLLHGNNHFAFALITTAV